MLANTLCSATKAGVRSIRFNNVVEEEQQQSQRPTQIPPRQYRRKCELKISLADVANDSCTSTHVSSNCYSSRDRRRCTDGDSSLTQKEQLVPTMSSSHYLQDQQIHSYERCSVRHRLFSKSRFTSLVQRNRSLIGLMLMLFLGVIQVSLFKSAHILITL